MRFLLDEDRIGSSYVRHDNSQAAETQALRDQSRASYTYVGVWIIPVMDVYLV